MIRRLLRSAMSKALPLAALAISVQEATAKPGDWVAATSVAIWTAVVVVWWR